jgi:hypothetical protein
MCHSTVTKVFVLSLVDWRKGVVCRSLPSGHLHTESRFCRVHGDVSHVTHGGVQGDAKRDLDKAMASIGREARPGQSNGEHRAPTQP